jgi:hypothetical protein
MPPLEVIRQHLASASPAVFPLDGVLQATLDVEPADASIGLRIPDDATPLPEISGYRHLIAERVWASGRTWLQVRVRGASLLEDGYMLLASVLERMRSDSLSFAEAFDVTLGNVEALLSGSRGLSDDAEKGLWGELRVLQRLIRTIGSADALAAWQGPTFGEHDFTLAGDDIEVKTTASERRLHWFGDPRQLQPVVGRRLWVLSLKITHSQGPGALTLQEMVDQTIELVSAAALSAVFARRLDAAGWSSNQTSILSRRWRLRDEPLALPVDDHFPGLDQAALDALGARTIRVESLQQRLNLDGLQAASDPPPQLDMNTPWGTDV